MNAQLHFTYSVLTLYIQCKEVVSKEVTRVNTALQLRTLPARHVQRNISHSSGTTYRNACIAALSEYEISTLRKNALLLTIEFASVKKAIFDKPTSASSTRSIHMDTVSSGMVF